MRLRVAAGLAVTMLVAGLSAMVASPAGAATTIYVSSAADSGDGSFREAVEAANADSDIEHIVFSGSFEVSLLAEVRFEGSQDLSIDGMGSTLSGASVPADTDTWDSGLFVADGGGDLTINNLTFADSFNNGLAVFIPGDAPDAVEITLSQVVVTDAQFHGVLVDGQSSTGYNTDDILHHACTDPHPVDAGVAVVLDVEKTVITGSGRLAGGYDTSLHTGCPQDFDGLRVDQGGEGGVIATIANSNFDANLADGAELDEAGNGSVDVTVEKTTFNGNGDTESVLCTAEAVADQALYGDDDTCDEGDLVTDLDDGFDIDEAGGGDLVAIVTRTTVIGNFDEGLDFDEADGGSIVLDISKATSSANNDEALKASEEGEGDVTAELSQVTFTDGGDDGTQIEEEDAGDIDVTVERSTVTGNAKYGVKVEESNAGGGSLTIDRSDLSGNGDGPYDSNVVSTITKTTT